MTKSKWPFAKFIEITASELVENARGGMLWTEKI